MCFSFYLFCFSESYLLISYFNSHSCLLIKLLSIYTIYSPFIQFADMCCCRIY